MYMNVITIIGMVGIFLYISTQILSFYDVDSSSYGPYLLFYGFLAISTLFLPHDNPKL
jgi:hypothetical protein